MIITKTPRLIIRNWRDDDLELMHVINSDEKVMAFFPFRRNREESRILMDLLRQMIDRTGFGFYALERISDGRTIGFAGLAKTDLEPVLPKGSVEIGWRLASEFWGEGYATEAARALLRMGFEERGLEEIVSFAVFNNIRSTAVMKRIGLKADPSRDFNHPNVPDTHSAFQPHVFYSITKTQWQAAQ